MNEVGRLGHTEVVPGQLEPHEIAAAGGVLGDIRGVVVGPDGTLYVLDRYWQKIVRFQPDGGVEDVVLGGEGRGPGEFIIPIDITSTARGVSVLDFNLNRITEFNWSGSLIGVHVLETRRGWRHLIRGDTIWIAYSSGGATQEPIFYRSLVTGENLDPGQPLPEEDQPFGTTVGLAFGTGGEVLATTARPGVWISSVGGKSSRRGSPLYRADPPPLEERIGPRQTRVTPAQHTASGLGMIGDSIVLQGFHSYDAPFDWADPVGRGAGSYFLGVYTAEGDHLATLSLPDGVITAFMKTEPGSGRIFLHSNDPFPQVVEYQLSECTSVQ